MAKVTWQLQIGDFPNLLQQQGAGTWPKPHAIFFDPFSPTKNPAMWTEDLFSALFRQLSDSRPCSLATYSRSTRVRAALLLAGFFVGRGQSSGRKEETTIAANTRGLISELLDGQWLERARRSESAEPLRTGMYRQARLSDQTYRRLAAHPQFRQP
jgi:queuine tRNA-ribosyltransferase